MDRKRLGELLDEAISEAEALRHHELARACLIGAKEEECCDGTPEDHSRRRDEIFGVIVAAFDALVKERDALAKERDERRRVEARTSDEYVRELYLTVDGGIDIIQVTRPDGSVDFYATGPMRAASEDAESDAALLELGGEIRKLAAARAAGDARRARPAPVDIAGRWSCPTGSLVFIGGPGTGYVWQDLNTLGSIVGEGEARVVENRVDMRGNNLLAGPVVGTLTLDEGGKLLRGELCLVEYVQGGVTGTVEFLRVSTSATEGASHG